MEIALLEDKKLVELHHEKADASFAVGDLYLGKVKKLIPGLNAAFVDVGFEKDAFLHYTDLSPYARSLLKFTQQAINYNNPNGFDFGSFQIEPEIVKTGKINEVLSGKPNILVKILKEPIAAKGPRLSCEVSLPGRFVVITPFNDIVAVSRKIHSSEERKRLQKIVEAIKPKNFGVIVRTAAEGKNTMTQATRTFICHNPEADPVDDLLAAQEAIRSAGWFRRSSVVETWPMTTEPGARRRMANRPARSEALGVRVKSTRRHSLSVAFTVDSAYRREPSRLSRDTWISAGVSERSQRYPSYRLPSLNAIPCLFRP